MKNRKLLLPLAGLLIFGSAVLYAAAPEKSKDEKKLESAAADLDTDAGQPEGRKTVADRIKADFNVDDARVQGLRDQNLGYGEVSIVLSLAQGMPDGITDANVQKVMALRQGPPVMGWGKAAKSLGVNLGQVISKVKRTQAEARKQIKAGKMKAGKPEKGGKAEKMEKPERPGKPERPERAERQERGGGRGKP